MSENAAGTATKGPRAMAEVWLLLPSPSRVPWGSRESVVSFYAFKRAKIGIKIGIYLELFCVSSSNKLNKSSCFYNYHVKLFLREV